jgi:histidyl-tRNA synthetase
LAQQFRAQGIACDVFTEAKKLPQQFTLAEKKGAQWLLIPPDNPDLPGVTMRDLEKRENRVFSGIAEAARTIQESLGAYRTGEFLGPQGTLGT